jgi:hypothetical protein
VDELKRCTNCGRPRDFCPICGRPRDNDHASFCPICDHASLCLICLVRSAVGGMIDKLEELGLL